MRYINREVKILKAIGNPLLALKWLFFHKIYLTNILYYFNVLFNKKKKFIFNNKAYKYYYAKHNYTYYNERCVELPIIFELLQNIEINSILEIGNVTSHYISSKHLIVDKYEISNLVINEDILTYNPKNKLSLICSISTIEHIGWDDYPRDHKKVLVCIERIIGFLEKGGVFVATAPMGYNQNLDKLITNKELGFTEYYFLKRIDFSGNWIQVTEHEIDSPTYNSPFPSANILFVGYYRN